MRWVLFLSVLCAGLARLPIAHAEDGTSSSAEPARDVSAEATRAFERGRVLIRDGNYAAACAAFAESQRLEAHVGTLMNLGLCERVRKRYASASAAYEAAADLAKRTGDDRRQLALNEAAQVGQLVQRATIEIIDAPPGTRIWLDGQELDPARAREGWPIDPGAHVVEVRASEWKQLVFEFHVEPDSQLKPLRLGPLEAVVPPAPPLTSASAQVGEVRKAAFNVRRWSLVAAGTGVGIAGAGAVLYAVGVGNAQSADCRPSSSVCSIEGKRDYDAAMTQARWGLGLMIAGGVLAGTSLAVFAFTPSRPSTSALEQQWTFGVAPDGAGPGGAYQLTF